MAKEANVNGKKVIFVGLHNKVDKMPLCSSTKSGKLIDRIINEGNIQNVIKTNLFDVDYYPTDDNENWARATELWQRVNVNEEDLLILLGAAVHKDFVNCPLHKYIIKIAHPASKRSHKEMDEYVRQTIQLIISQPQ